jgi:hypothetical protein
VPGPMPDGGRLGRAEIEAVLAELEDRPAAAGEEVPRGSDPDGSERIGSLELAWLVHRVEQLSGRRIDLDDEQFAAVRTVSDAVRILGTPHAHNSDD